MSDVQPSRSPADRSPAVFPVPGWLSPVSQALQSPNGRASALFVGLGLSLGVVIPASHAVSTLKTTLPAQPHPQLISQGTKRITLVSYAVTKSAYSKIIPLFTADWKKKTGETVVFQQSYGGSGSQTRAVIDGLNADVVQLALAGDIDKIQKAGLINPGWTSEAPNGAIVTRSVIAIVTRPGNPKKIQTWSDLVKPGIKVITANPKTSGGAKWNFLGLWGSVTENGGTEAKARQFVTQVYKNVPILPKDAREASDVFFKQDQGDVLLNYENEVILAKQQGENSTYVIPQTNISIEGPVAVVDKNVDKNGTRKVAEAFVKFLYTPAAQQAFAGAGFRPVDPAAAKKVNKNFPVVKKLYTVKDFGGWNAIDKKFFADNAIFDQILSTKR